jgi:hypothetical protein
MIVLHEELARAQMDARLAEARVAQRARGLVRARRARAATDGWPVDYATTSPAVARSRRDVTPSLV